MLPYFNLLKEMKGRGRLIILHLTAIDAISSEKTGLAEKDNGDSSLLRHFITFLIQVGIQQYLKYQDTRSTRRKITKNLKLLLQSQELQM